jgi:hypothetical protein
MNIARAFFAIAFAMLLCGASRPKVETSILLAKPIKIVKVLGYKKMEDPDLPDGMPSLPGDGMYIVKMKLLSVSEGKFSKGTFNAYIEAPTEKHIFVAREWVVVVIDTEGEKESIVGLDVRRSFCSSPEQFAKIDAYPRYLYSQTYADGYTPKEQCYEVH